MVHDRCDNLLMTVGWFGTKRHPRNSEVCKSDLSIERNTIYSEPVMHSTYAQPDDLPSSPMICQAAR